MTFQPVVPFGGFAGWQFLQRTIDAQRSAFDASPVRQREVDYFKENIGTIGSAEELVGDRKLLAVALGAFGLEADVNNRFFIRKVLEEGTDSRGALANRLTDTRYRLLSAAFGFGGGVLPNTFRAGFGEDITNSFLERQFEVGVGEGDQSMRLALTLERELPGIAGRAVANDTKWLTIMGNPPLRAIFETALGLPQSFGALSIDRQLDDFKTRSERTFGTSDVAVLGEGEMLDDVLRTYLARAQLAEKNTVGFTPASTALTLISRLIS